MHTIEGYAPPACNTQWVEIQIRAKKWELAEESLVQRK